MYSRAEAAELRPEILHDAIRSLIFGTLIVADEAGSPQVATIPFVLKTDGDAAVLEAHVARANAIWKLLPRPALVLFQGPQAYVRPGWYATKREHGKVVPTWAYVAIEARGTVATVDDMATSLLHVRELSDVLEGGQSQPWSVDDAPEGFIPALARGIVALRMPVESLAGVWKLNQHRSEGDQAGMIEGFEGRDDTGAAALAAIMRARSGVQGS